MSRGSEALSYQLPNAIWGTFDERAYAPDRVNASTPGFGDGLARRFVRACQAFGQFPRTPPDGHWFMQVPVVTDAYLDADTGSGGATTLDPGVLAIAVRPTGRLDHKDRPGGLAFHGIFLSEDAFASMEDQAFTLWQRDVFPDLASWDVKQEKLPFIEVTRDEARPGGLPGVALAEVELLRRELHHVLQGGDVAFSMKEVTADSERHLALLQLGLPRTLRHDLGFATQLGDGLYKRKTQRDLESFAICGVTGESPFDPNRAELLSPRRKPEGSPEALTAYCHEYTRHVATGDLAQLLRLGRKGIARDVVPPPRRGFLGWRTRR